MDDSWTEDSAAADDGWGDVTAADDDGWDQSPIDSAPQSAEEYARLSLLIEM